jgi:hypothetical protein
MVFHRPSVRELGLPRINWMISACPSESTAYDFLASSLLDCEAAQTESCSSGLQYPQNDLKRLTNCKWLRAGIRTFSCHSASSPHFDRCFLCCHHESTTRLLEKAGYVLASLLLRIWLETDSFWCIENVAFWHRRRLLLFAFVCSWSAIVARTASLSLQKMPVLIAPRPRSPHSQPVCVDFVCSIFTNVAFCDCNRWTVKHRISFMGWAVEKRARRVSTAIVFLYMKNDIFCFPFVLHEFFSYKQKWMDESEEHRLSPRGSNPETRTLYCLTVNSYNLAITQSFVKWIVSCGIPGNVNGLGTIFPNYQCACPATS